MKPLLAAIAGFSVSAGVFISGAAVATYLIMAEPVQTLDASQNVAELQSQMPGTADAATRDVRRVPMDGDKGSPEPESEAKETPADSGRSSGSPVEEIDMISTGSTGAPDDPENKQSSESQQTLPAAHVEWCSAKYRSYQPETNSYTANSGETRTCTSPHTTAETPVSNDSGERRSARNEGILLSPEHVRACSSRYRSYRPEDNSYQPYGGDPRRQCR